MGTVARVTLGAEHADRIESVLEPIREIFRRLETEMSARRADSGIAMLSKMAGVAPVVVSEDTYRVLDLGGQFGWISEGAFDLTAAPLASLWGFNGAPAPATLPSDRSIRACLERIDYRRLILRDGTAFLPVPDMAVDVGGIAKGYAVDRAYEYCLSAGIPDFLIDFSGNIRAAGRPARRECWQIGIRDPFDASRIVCTIALPSGMAVSTSGSYERFVEIFGQRYSHIIDPRTGYPANGTASVTVLCADAVTADALSTAFFVAGPNGAQKLRQRVPSAELLIVPDRYPAELCLTRGAAKALAPVREVGNLRIVADSWE